MAVGGARNYQVVYARSVVEFMRREVSSKRVYERLAAYRSILAAFPEVGEVYGPVYETARPLSPVDGLPSPVRLSRSTTELMRGSAAWRFSPSSGCARTQQEDSR